MSDIDPVMLPATLAPLSDTPNKDERMWAMFAHLAVFSFLILPVVGNFLGPLVVWLIKKDEMPLVDDQGKEALNFQISLLILGCVLVLMFFGVSFVLLLIPFIGWAVLAFLVVAIKAAAWVLVIVVIAFPIVAGIKANNGEAYRYPFTLRLIK